MSEIDGTQIVDSGVEVNSTVTTDNTDPAQTVQAIQEIKVAPASQIRNPWICNNCGAIMGAVHQDKIRQGMSVSRLILFRGAVYVTENLPENFAFGKVDAGEFGCSRYGHVREFRASPEFIRYTMEKRHAPKKNRNV